MSSYFAGVFSDGTQTFCRLEDENGALVSTGQSKSANIAYSVNITWESIKNAVNNALIESGLTIELSDLNVCAGIKGTELPESYTRIVQIGEKNFKQFKVFSDGYVAYKTVFTDQAGILIIADEGIVSYTQNNEDFRKIGGWGFPQADEGSTSWIGAQAINHAFKVCDEVEDKSALSEAILSKFNHSGLELCEFAMHHSAPRDFAQFYDLVLVHYMEKDPAAKKIISQSMNIIAKLIDELDAHNNRKYPIYFDGKMKDVLNSEFKGKPRVVKKSTNYSDKAKTAITLLRKIGQ